MRAACPDPLGIAVVEAPEHVRVRALVCGDLMERAREDVVPATVRHDHNRAVADEPRKRCPKRRPILAELEWRVQRIRSMPIAVDMDHVTPLPARLLQAAIPVQHRAERAPAGPPDAELE